MFFHAFSYNLKVILRSREAVFWSLIYPLLLATLFFFAFGNLRDHDRFKAIDIAVVESEVFAPGSALYAALSEVSDIDGEKGEGDLFSVSLTGKDEAEMLLQGGSIAAYVFFEGEVKLSVADSGYAQTITKMFLDEYQQIYALTESILAENPGAAQEGLIEAVSEYREYLSAEGGGSGKENETVIFFYSLLAMTCLMGSTVAVDEVIRLQADMSAKAARINLAPVFKFKIFLFNICAVTVYQIAVIFIVLAYLIFALGVDFGGRVPYILLTCVMGGITGIFFGTTVSTGFRTDGIKYAITIAGTMLSCFLAGLMVVDIKYLVHEHLPAVAYLSPANLITDALYCLYYYEDLSRFFLNIGLLACLSAALCAVTCFAMRRKRYASL